jgi:DNA repair exonuclease SbcCD ATPase subunit
MKILKHINIQGFRSIKSMSFNIADKGMHLIQGKNGSGKSTIMEAIYYALYGKTIKDTNLTDIPTLNKYRDTDFEGTKVSLTIVVDGIDYEITRTINYGKDRDSSIQIKTPNGLVPITDKADAQAKIDTIVGVSSKVFSNSVFFAQKGTRLIDSKDADRRDILDEIFSIGLDVYESKAKEEVTKLDLEIKDLISNISINQVKLDALDTKYISDKEIYDNFYQTQKDSIEANKVLLEEAALRLRTYPDDLVEVIPVPLPNNEELHNIKFRLQAEKNVYAQLEAKSIVPPSTKCPTCSGDISKDILDNLTKVYKAQKKDLDTRLLISKKEVDKLQAQLDAAQEDFDIKTKEYRDNQELLIRNNSIAKARQELESNVNFYTKIISTELSRECPITEDKLKDTLERKQVLSAQSAAFDKELKDKEKLIVSYKYWASTGFTFKGMKSFILQSMLQSLNNTLLTYSSKLGLVVNIGLKIDTKSKSFDINITDTKGISKSYESLSGGEQKRVDIILSFAIHDILSKHFSILVVDEFFEGLDEEGLDIAMSLLREKAQNQAVYMITHNINIDLSECSIIEVIKENNSTKIL